MDNKNPRPWPPNAMDCSQGYCSYYCPQWCFFFFPSPPPPPPSSHPLLSPILIAFIAVTTTALVILAYYLILARCRARHRSSSPAPPPLSPAFGFPVRNEGLDDNLISTIKTYQYQTGGSLVVDGTDCSVCLSPFQDGDEIRLLPKCKHAFHQCCIDTWLKSHSNCPLCRACIFPPQEGQESESESEVRIDRNSEIIEIGEGRGVIGRSLSMDSPFQRHMGADAATGINSVRWSRNLHFVISPMRMKRSRSMTSAVARGSRSAILPT